MTRLILLNKPFGVLCQFTGEGATLADLVPVPGVYPAGRLDKDSKGLLLLTDDGKLQDAIASPRHELSKTYYVQVEGTVSTAALQALRDGVRLSDGPTRPAQVQRLPPPELWPRDPPVRFRKSVPDQWLALTISEGRNRQVRRMTASVGHPTLRLVRWRIGPWTLDNLPIGTWQEVTDPWGALPAEASQGRTARRPR